MDGWYLGWVEIIAKQKKVLINDSISKEGIDLFIQKGYDVDTTKRDPDDLLKEISKYHALIVRSSTKVTEEILEAGAPPNGNLIVVGRSGNGIDNVKIDAASKYGVIVKNSPGGSTTSTALHSLTLLLSLIRNIPQSHYSLTKGIWRKKDFIGCEATNKVLGIIGCGRIGQKLSELVSGLDMKVIGHDQNMEYPLKNFPESRIEYTTKSDLIKNADFICLHTGGSDIVIGEKEISAMRNNQYIVNASRSSNLDHDRLYTALFNNKIGGLALDVHEDEPKENERFISRYQGLSNVILSSHLGASTEEAERKNSIEIANVVIDYLLSGNYENSLNAQKEVEKEEKQTYPLFIFHEDKPGVFASIDKILSESDINIREPRSRQIGENGHVQTVYLTHQEVPQTIVNKINNLNFVKYAKN